MRQNATPPDEAIDTLTTSLAGRRRTWWAAGFCSVTLLATLALLPVAAHPMAAIPGFVASYQSALVLVYVITTLLLFVQFFQNRSLSILVLAAGSLYTTGTVFLQLLAFPNVMTAGLLIGQGPDTLIWLWTFWHVAPPLFALGYALLERSGNATQQRPRVSARTGWLAAAASLAAVFATGVLVSRYVQYLPKNVQGDNYWLLTASGVGPAVELLTVVALGTLCWTTRLRTTLQLLIAVSLFLLALDNVVTDVGSARGTIGWMAGRMEALMAALAILAMYLTELDALRARAQSLAVAREGERLIAVSARDHLDTVLGAAGMGGWDLDFATGAIRRTFRYDQIFGQPESTVRWGLEDVLDHVIPEDRDLAAAAFAKAWTSGRLQIDCRIRRSSDGETRWIAVQAKTRYDEDRRPVAMAGCVMDTTERRQTEDRTRDAARMESIGRLTGGIAHDFNNMLAIITGNLEMIECSGDEPETVSHCLDSAMAAAWRGAEMVGTLLAFSRQQVMRRETVDTNRLMEKFAPLLQQAAGEKVELVVDLGREIEPARLDTQKLLAALLNLAANARDAMPSGGRVTIRTGNFVCSDEDAEHLGIAVGPYVRIAMEDTGFGMDADTGRLAFEPFFTTKQFGKGPGLGLSQVFGFARQEGGTARIDSRVGTGTTVELLLPAWPEAGVITAPAGGDPQRRTMVPIQRATRGEVVLVVDDDLAVQTVTVSFLRSLGYKTLAADSAATALERLRGLERIDLMLTDVVMPGGLNGVQLSLAARAIREDLKVILTSGYTSAALAQDDQGLPAGMPLLSKPYARGTLASTVESALRRPERSVVDLFQTA